MSNVCCEDTWLFSLIQRDEAITCSSGCIFSASRDWYLLATSMPSREVAWEFFQNSIFRSASFGRYRNGRSAQSCWSVHKCRLYADSWPWFWSGRCPQWPDTARIHVFAIITHIGASPNAPMCSGQRTYVKMPTHIRAFIGAILSAVYDRHL